MIYTRHGVAVDVVNARHVKAAPRAPGWELDLKSRSDGHEMTRYLWELKADGGTEEILAECARFEQVTPAAHAAERTDDENQND